MKLKSQKISTMDKETIHKLAYRVGLGYDEVANYYVTFIDDEPNLGESRRNGSNYSNRTITTALITPKPVNLDIVALGSAIKSPDDSPDGQRGETIALARAIRGL
jgi:hypothetical protein